MQPLVAEVRMRRLLLPFLIVCTCLQAEDVKLREQAVQLMEVANAVSLPGGLPSFEHTVTFRVHELDGTVKEGRFTRVSAGAAGHRDEITFGDYHAVIVISGERISQHHTTAVPPEVRELRRQLPIHLGRFDQSDVIQAVQEANILGRPAKCIAFDTLTNGVMQNNEICMDTERGVVLRWRVGDEYIENTDFFRIANLYEPAHIRRYLRHQLQMEIDQGMKLIDGPVDPNVFTPPSSEWNTTYQCSTSRRPVAVFTPQPPPGKNGDKVVDVLVHGNIRRDGKVHGAVVDSSPDPTLNAEALQLISTWKFLPLICNDEPASLSTDFVLHFQGR
jgi:hypothetical protein